MQATRQLFTECSTIMKSNLLSSVFTSKMQTSEVSPKKIFSTDKRKDIKICQTQARLVLRFFFQVLTPRSLSIDWLDFSFFFGSWKSADWRWDWWEIIARRSNANFIVVFVSGQPVSLSYVLVIVYICLLIFGKIFSLLFACRRSRYQPKQAFAYVWTLTSVSSHRVPLFSECVS